MTLEQYLEAIADLERRVGVLEERVRSLKESTEKSVEKFVDQRRLDFDWLEDRV